MLEKEYASYRHTTRVSAGFSMVEILVSVVVLSLGMLGIAAMQTTSFKFNHDAYLRTIAVAQANIIIDRMRANLPAVEDGDYLTGGATTTVPSCTVCSSSQTAAIDLDSWNNNNANLLPVGQGTVTYDGTSNLFIIRVMWDSNKTGATGTDCSGNSSVDLSCVQIYVRL